MWSDVFGAVWRAGMPVGLVSFALVFWLLRTGHLDASGDLWRFDRAVDDFNARRKGARRKRRKGKTPDSPAAATAGGPGYRRVSRAHEKWLEFGGGFYGVVALITFLRIELAEVRDWLFQFGALADFLRNFDIGLVISLVIDSILNFIAAITWPVYWLSEIRGGSVLTWLLAAYLGYWLGIRLAAVAVRRYPPPA